MRVRLTKRACAQIERATAWWEENRPLAPDAMREELAGALALLGAQPAIGSLARNARAKGVRRVHLARVHYYLYYRVSEDEVQVLALWHTSRGTEPQL